MSGQTAGYLLALALTLGTEVPIVAALYPGQRARMALVCAASTTFTHLVLHFAMPHLVPARMSMVAGEAQALLVEAASYALLSRPRSAARGLVASAVANASSFALGIYVFGG